MLKSVLCKMYVSYISCVYNTYDFFCDFSPVKTEFIRSKYQFLQFVNKQRDGELSSIDDLSKVKNKSGLP